MIPDNVLSTQVIRSRFNFPDSVAISGMLEDYELGGVALQDPSQGLEVKPWYGYWSPVDNTAYLVPDIDAAPIAIFTEPNVIEFSFTFDQNMRWAAAYFVADGTCKFRWFDSQVAAYVTSTYTGLTALKLCLDDKRTIQVQLGASDMLFTYIRDNTLYLRAQRDRFTIEYPLRAELPSNLRITNFGMAANWRVQWRLRYRTFEELLPWLQ